MAYISTEDVKDDEGRFIILEITYHGVDYLIGSMYAPTRNFEQHQIQVLEKLSNEIISTEITHICLGGDWNLYLIPILDKLHSMSDGNDNSKYRNHLKSFLDVNNLVDVWRALNPTKRVFTWHRGDKRSRLDYFFCSDHMLNSLKDVSILPGIHSDHSLLSLQFDSGETQIRGKGFWKFNENLIQDIEYVRKMKSLIKEKIDEYDMSDLGLKWDLIKMDIRNFTIPYTCHKIKERKKHETLLNKKYEDLFHIVNTNNTVPENTLNEYNKIKKELELIEREKARGVIMRSKVQFVEEGEKCTSYFLRLEKSNYINKHISQLKDTQNDTIITNPQQILDMEREYYKKLYQDPYLNQIDFQNYKQSIF